MRALSVLIAMVLSISPAIGASLNDFMFAKGVCEKFVLAGQNMTKECSGKLLNSAYNDGRSGFYFTFKRGGIITFSGLDRPNPTPDTDLFAIDKIVFSQKADSKTFDATGSCRYGNFRSGYKRVTCKGNSDDGAVFEAVFRMTTPPEPF